MNKDQIKGKANQIKGEIKDRAGGALGDAKMQTEGKTDKATGKIQEGIGDLKDKVSGPPRPADSNRR